MSRKKHGAKGPSERKAIVTSRANLNANPRTAHILKQNDYQKRLAKVLREQGVNP